LGTIQRPLRLPVTSSTSIDPSPALRHGKAAACFILRARIMRIAPPSVTFLSCGCNHPYIDNPIAKKLT
jgi:hypothetical protein